MGLNWTIGLGVSSPGFNFWVLFKQQFYWICDATSVISLYILFQGTVSDEWLQGLSFSPNNMLFPILLPHLTFRSMFWVTCFDFAGPYCVRRSFCKQRTLSECGMWWLYGKKTECEVCIKWADSGCLGVKAGFCYCTSKMVELNG